MGESKRDKTKLDPLTGAEELVQPLKAVEFCKPLSALPAEQRAGRLYRLPSEAE